VALRKFERKRTLGGYVFWDNHYQFNGWRVQYNGVYDRFTPLKAYRLIDGDNRLIAIGDSASELMDELPSLMVDGQEVVSGLFSEDSFWDKLRTSSVLKSSLEQILTLYYLFKSPDTPGWAKARIIATLGYFILPTDLIPDVIVAIGYSDDLALIAAALVSLAVHITPEIRGKAKDKTQQIL
jgi:uncharacterized membrane protein YkvA (DUF1232 family)